MHRLIFKYDTDRRKISKYCHGQFIEHLGGCIYDGIWVGENSAIPNQNGIRLDTIHALKQLEISAIRWPGGLFADNYHWRDGIGPRHKRPVRQNLGWNTLESNHLGTHEFMHLCELVGAEPYLCLNLGSGTVEEACNWAEYCNCDLDTSLTRERAANGHPEPFNVKFWSLGNEPGYPMDGMMRGSYYADVARRYAGYVKFIAAQAVYAQDPRFRSAGIKMTLADNRFAHEAVEDNRNAYFDLLAAHIYEGREVTLDASPEAKFQALIASLPKIAKQIRSACELAEQLSTHDHSVDVAVDEWGVWKHEATPFNGLAQDNTLGDALFAAAVLHIFYSENKVFMANLAQTINVLQALIQTNGENFCLTPTYHVFEMFKVHQGAEFLKLEKPANQLPQISVSASIDIEGKVHISLVNMDLENALNLRCEIPEFKVSKLHGRILTAKNIGAQNTFSAPRIVAPVPFKKAFLDNDKLNIELPPRSVVMLELNQA